MKCSIFTRKVFFRYVHIEILKHHNMSLIFKSSKRVKKYISALVSSGTVGKHCKAIK